PMQRECAKTAPAGMPGSGQQASEGTAMGERPQEDPAAPTAGKAVVKMLGYPPEFESCWEVYPRQLEKQAAYKAWKARIGEGYSPEVLLSCTINYADSCRRNGTERAYTKHPKTFFGRTLPFLDYQHGPIIERQKGNSNGRSGDHGDPMDWEDKFWRQ
ncbi:MAG: hypothetical protein QW100_02325, partial [Thermoplasmatales archaeon]